MRFHTGAERCQWLNTSLFVAKHRFLGPAVSNMLSTA
jgi:hypothetical protein